MPSNHQLFFALDQFAVIGATARKPFPILTYRGLKKIGKTVHAIDPTISSIDGEHCFDSLDDLPEPVAGVIIEVPKAEVADWVERAAAASVRDVWIHMALDTPEALAVAARHGINARTGRCAVMYLNPGISAHGVHRLIARALGSY